MKRKILFFLPDLSGGGAERVTLNIINKLPKEQFDITILLVRNIIMYEVSTNIRVVSLKKEKIIYSILELRKFIKKNKFDVLYSTLLDTHIALYLSLLGINNRSKVILRQPNSPLLLIKNKQISFIKTKFIEYIYKKCDQVISQTPEMKEELANIYNIDYLKITTLTNPIDEKNILKKITNINSPFDTSVINIVAAGRISLQKGYDILIKAFSFVNKINKNYILHIIGEDKGEKNNLEKLINDLSLNDYVKFWGFQNNPYKFFHYSDIYVLSSRWEGLPNTVLENLFLGKRIIATKCIPFLETILKNNKSSFLVEIDDVEGLADKILRYKELKPNKEIFSSNNLIEIFKK